MSSMACGLIAICSGHLCKSNMNSYPNFPDTSRCVAFMNFIDIAAFWAFFTFSFIALGYIIFIYDFRILLNPTYFLLSSICSPIAIDQKWMKVPLFLVLVSMHAHNICWSLHKSSDSMYSWSSPISAGVITCKTSSKYWLNNTIWPLV